MASPHVARSDQTPILGAGSALKTVSGNVEMVDFPGYDEEVQQVFRSLGWDKERVRERFYLERHLPA